MPKNKSEIKTDEIRADIWLTQKGYAASRSQAQRLIENGGLWRANNNTPWKTMEKNTKLPPLAQIQLTSLNEAKYVSRGGLKLEGALEITKINPEGLICLDVGQSTGGFTDCLLKANAKQIIGIDVGQNQLHPAIKENNKVISFEKINARNFTPQDIKGAPDKYDLIVGDLSFISITLILPNIKKFLKEKGNLILLIKPQFELQTNHLNKKGIVKNPDSYKIVKDKITTEIKNQNLKLNKWFQSPIKGGEGNTEFFIHCTQTP